MLWLGLALLPAAGAVSAGTNQDAPDGMPAGPVYFAPWFQTEVLADDNLFRLSDEQASDDVATTVRVGVTAQIPVRMSNLEIGYEGSTFAYRDTNFANTATHIGSVAFDLNFSSYNTLRIEETYTSGVTELQRADVTGDIIRQGVPYARNRWAVEWLREVTRGPSFRARIERGDLKYRPDELTIDIPWLDHEGWEVEYEYIQPFYRRGGLIGKYNARRQDQFEAGTMSNWDPPVPDSVPLRREEYDGFEVGYRGLIGRHQPLLISLGYGKLALRDIQGSDETPSDYRGLIGTINWRLPVGGLSNMAVTLNRRPLSSIFNTYYIVNDLRVRFDRRFREVSQWGVNLLASSNRYGDAVDTTATMQFVPCNLDDKKTGDQNFARKDRGQQIEGFWEWTVQPRVALRMAATHNRRDSNCNLADYSSNALGMTFKLGWF
jgi:hypothetical protein